MAKNSATSLAPLAKQQSLSQRQACHFCWGWKKHERCAVYEERWTGRVRYYFFDMSSAAVGVPSESRHALRELFRFLLFVFHALISPIVPIPLQHSCIRPPIP